MNSELMQRLVQAMDEEEERAWASLEGYKFYMFGYHAAAWVRLNTVSGLNKANPFSELVRVAKINMKNQPARLAVLAGPHPRGGLLHDGPGKYTDKER